MAESQPKNNYSKTGAPVPNVVYEEIVDDGSGRKVIAFLYEDGTLLIGRSATDMRRAVFAVNPKTNKAWIPERDEFVSIIRQALINGDYDIDGTVVSVDNFLASLKNEDTPKE